MKTPELSLKKLVEAQEAEAQKALHLTSNINNFFTIDPKKYPFRAFILQECTELNAHDRKLGIDSLKDLESQTRLIVDKLEPEILKACKHVAKYILPYKDQRVYTKGQYADLKEVMHYIENSSIFTSGVLKEKAPEDIHEYIMQTCFELAIFEPEVNALQDFMPYDNAQQALIRTASEAIMGSNHYKQFHETIDKKLDEKTGGIKIEDLQNGNIAEKLSKIMELAMGKEGAKDSEEHARFLSIVLHNAKNLFDMQVQIFVLDILRRKGILKKLVPKYSKTIATEPAKE